MFTVVAYYESVDPGAAYNALTAVPDPHVFVSGDDIRVPTGMNYLIGAACEMNDASGARARVSSPSLRARLNFYLEKFALALVYGNPPEINIFPESPIFLEPDEAINLEVYSDPAAGVVHQGEVFLSDGRFAPVTGEILTVRATGAAALAAATWVNSALTFEEDLPVGRYAVVGMRARGTNLNAARLVFRADLYRPGTIAINAVADQDPPYFRRGGLGVWGEFHTNQPPTVDCLGVTDTSQVFLLDLTKVG